MAVGTPETIGVPHIDDAIANWLSLDKNEATRKDILDLVERKDAATLEKILCSRLEFGTAGLRAAMGAGFARMNQLTIIQTAQGFVEYVLNMVPDAKSRGIVLGHDHRHNSRIFAELSAAVFTSKDVKTYFYDQNVCTPLVPFAVVKYNAAAGVMVTASHNPKDDNGYKVYWGNGAQITEPHDAGISSSILKNLTPWFDVMAETQGIKSRTVDIFADVMADYLEKANSSLSVCRELNGRSPVLLTYTAMHGVGAPFVAEMFAKFGLHPYRPVVQQIDADPDFPTVKYPNPEEGKSALNLAIETANAANSRHILANDPDADRLAVAEKQSDNSWRVLKGNEIGSLFAWWTFRNWRARNPNGNPQSVSMIASTVSSKFIKAMAEKEGFVFVETLTGFKWIANAALKEQSKGQTVLFGYEEAIGFMVGLQVPDKDGVVAAAVMAEMINTLAEDNMTLSQQLCALYRQYGFFTASDSYFICNEKAVIKSLFEKIRNNGNYPTQCGSFKIRHVRDLTTGYDDRFEDKQARLPVDPTIQMITFYFENGANVTMRTSGTEPKIKYYSELSGEYKNEEDVSRIMRELEEVVDSVVQHFYEPKKNNLIAKS